MKIDSRPRSVNTTFNLPVEIAAAWKTRCDLYGLDHDHLLAWVMLQFLSIQNPERPGHGQVAELREWKRGSRKIRTIPRKRPVRVWTAPAADVPTVEVPTTEAPAPATEGGDS